jgi:hypothetical protein
MVRLTTRVETLREVLEKFLDDDSDMKDLNLTAKVGLVLGGSEIAAVEDRYQALVSLAVCGHSLCVCNKNRGTVPD